MIRPRTLLTEVPRRCPGRRSPCCSGRGRGRRPAPGDPRGAGGSWSAGAGPSHRSAASSCACCQAGLFARRFRAGLPNESPAVAAGRGRSSARSHVRDLRYRLPTSTSTSIAARVDRADALAVAVFAASVTLSSGVSRRTSPGCRAGRRDGGGGLLGPPSAGPARRQPTALRPPGRPVRVGHRARMAPRAVRDPLAVLPASRDRRGRPAGPVRGDPDHRGRTAPLDRRRRPLHRRAPERFAVRAHGTGRRAAGRPRRPAAASPAPRRVSCTTWPRRPRWRSRPAGAPLALAQARDRLVLAREEERRRLRRDLHDGVASALVGPGC